MATDDFFDGREVHVGMDVGGREFVVSTEHVAAYVAGTGTVDIPGGYTPALVYHSEVYRSLDWYLPNIVGNLHTRQEWDLFFPMWVREGTRRRVFLDVWCEKADGAVATVGTASALE